LLQDFKRFAGERTLVFYDVRNRGRSDPVTDEAKLSRGILQDVDDLETIRRHFGLTEMTLIGHSYIGLMLALYAKMHPAHVERAVQIGPMQSDMSKQYPAHLTGADATLKEVFSKIAQLQKERAPDEDPEEACKKFWSVLRVIYVTDPANADKIDWGRCDLPNERNLWNYFNTIILPSVQSLKLGVGAFANAKAPILIIHGTRDRSAPYGGARDWAMMLPNAPTCNGGRWRSCTVDRSA
jgi:pimeloyl-ACP methyl ester carboxylesterase